MRLTKQAFPQPRLINNSRHTLIKIKDPSFEQNIVSHQLNSPDRGQPDNNYR